MATSNSTPIYTTLTDVTGNSPGVPQQVLTSAAVHPSLSISDMADDCRCERVCEGHGVCRTRWVPPRITICPELTLKRPCRCDRRAAQLVQGFGCRPIATFSTELTAGFRKPPRKEPAGA